MLIIRKINHIHIEYIRFKGPSLDHDELLRYLAGYVYGDGNLYHDVSRGCYVIRLYDKNYEHLHKISTLVHDLLNKKVSIYKRSHENLYIVKFYSKELFFKIKEKIREALEKSQLSIDFIRGILDAEGCVYIRKRGSNIDIELNIASKNIELLRKITEYLLIRAGVKSNIVVRTFKNPDRIVGYLGIFGLKDTCTVVSILRPLHPRFYPLYDVCSLSSPERELGKLAP